MKRKIIIFILILCGILLVNNLTSINRLYIYKITYMDNTIDTIQSSDKFSLVIHEKTGKGVVKSKGKYICYNVKSLIEISDSIKY